jgi:hypothetical protein
MRKFFASLIGLVFVLGGCSLGSPVAQVNPPKNPPPAAPSTSTQPIVPKQPVACTQEAKICPDGTAVGRSGPNCDFAQCPSAQNQTVNWKILSNAQYGFQFMYPTGFFDASQPPQILVGDCNYGVFPGQCPNINDIVINNMAAAGGDINAIKSNLANPNYWLNPAGDKLTVNDVSYCLYRTGDAAMSHTYSYDYYVTVIGNKCLVVNLNTSQTNCEVYLPLEKGNTEQAANYQACLVKNQDQPKTLSQIIATFKFNVPAQTGCNSDSDCQNGATCMVVGPLIANQPVRKMCIPKGSAAPL